MGTRTVTTVFAVQGEADYKKSVQNINREIKALDAALKLNQTEWANQEESIKGVMERAGLLNEAYQKQAEKVGIIEDAWKNCKETAKKYEEQIGKIKDAINKTKEEMDKLSGEGQGDSDAFTKLKENLEKLEKELGNKEAMYDGAIRGAVNWETALYNARGELIEVERELDGANQAVIDKFITPMEGAEEAVGDVTEAAETMETKVPNALDVVAQAVAAAGLAEAFGKVRDAMQECIEKSRTFETDVAGVFKTVDLSAEEEAAMADAIKQLATEIPATTTEIASVAEAAGQLGIAKNDILAFSEVMLKLGTTTNLSSSEAAESLSKFSNIIGLDVNDFERLGSAIVDLGNNGSSTEKEIVEMATRMAATGDIVGLTAQDMLAYAAALADVGIEAEAGGSAISKMFKKIQLAVEAGNLGETLYDEVAGMSPEEFTKLWGDDPARALLAFINGLQRMEEEGTSAVAVLDDMGITEIRLSNGMLALTAAGELLENHLNRAYKAWEENSALEEEAARRYETLDSKITILSNAFTNFETAIGDDFNKTLAPTVENLTGFFNIATDMAEESPAISTGLSAIGGGLGTITALTTGATIISGIAKAVSLFGPHAAGITLAAGAIGAIAGAVINLVNNSENVSESVQEVLDANDKILEKTEKSKTVYEENMAAAELNKEKVEDLIEKLWEFYTEGEKTETTEAIIRDSVNRLNELLPGLGLTYDEVTDKINLTRRAMEEFAEAAANQKMLDALNQYLEEAVSNQLGLEIQAKSTEYELEAAREREEEARRKLEELDVPLGDNAFATGAYYSSEEYKAYASAKKEREELEKDLEAIGESLSELESEVAKRNQIYDDMVDEMNNAAEKAIEMARTAEVLDATIQAMQHHGLAEFGNMSAAEQEFYRNIASATTLGNTSGGAGFLISSAGGVTNNYNVTIDAKNVKEFNDIVRIAEQEKQSIRMGWIKE